MIEEVYRRIAALRDNPVFIHVVPQEEALAKARAAKGPLAGVPFAVKDNIDVAGIPTTAACPSFSYVPKSTAPAVQNLLDAGAVLVGKTNLDQFATGLVGTRSPYGACRNAFDPAYISGGSSSGSALAVALGMARFALGTDTAGSGRVPASPVANWSRLVLPTSTAPASRSFCTAGAVLSGTYEKEEQAAVVGIPATSMLSFTAKGNPASGPFAALACASASSCGTTWMKTGLSR